MKTEKEKTFGRGKERVPGTWAYPAEFRLKVVRLFLEEGYSAVLLAEQFGISSSAIQRWVRLYRQRGIEGLEIKPRCDGKTNEGPCLKSAADGRGEKGPPGIRPATDCRCPQTIFPDSHESIDGSQNAVREGVGKQGQAQTGKESIQAPVLRTLPSQPAVAKRHHDLPAGGSQRLPDRLHGRLQPLHHLPGAVSQPDRRPRAGDLPPRLPSTVCPGDAHRQRPAVHQLAGQDPV
jgi:hypothetical protein